MDDLVQNDQFPPAAPEMPLTNTASPGVNWRQVGLFLGLTFGLTWLLDLILYFAGGLKAPGLGTILQLQMLLPATCATLLGTFFFPNSPLYYKVNHSAVRWFTYFFLLQTALYVVAALLVLLKTRAKSYPGCSRVNSRAGRVGDSGAGALARREAGLRRSGDGRRQMAILVNIWAWVSSLLRPANAAQFAVQAGNSSRPGNCSPTRNDAGHVYSADLAVRYYQRHPDRPVYGADHHLWRGIWLAWLSAERADPRGTDKGRALAGHYLGRVARTSDPDGL